MTRQQELADLARQWALSTPDASDIPAVLAFLADVRARRNRAEHQAIVDRQAIVYGIRAAQVDDAEDLARFRRQVKAVEVAWCAHVCNDSICVPIRLAGLHGVCR